MTDGTEARDVTAQKGEQAEGTDLIVRTDRCQKDDRVPKEGNRNQSYFSDGSSKPEVFAVSSP